MPCGVIDMVDGVLKESLNVHTREWAYKRAPCLVTNSVCDVVDGAQRITQRAQAWMSIQGGSMSRDTLRVWYGGWCSKNNWLWRYHAQTWMSIQVGSMLPDAVCALSIHTQCSNNQTVSIYVCIIMNTQRLHTRTNMHHYAKRLQMLSRHSHVCFIHRYHDMCIHARRGMQSKCVRTYNGDGAQRCCQVPLYTWTSAA